MTLIYMILMLGIIVFIHEFGHFIFAKRAGIYVYEFSLGMGPKLFKFNLKNDETNYCLRLFPIGGFVQMAGEEIDVDEKIPVEKRMQSKTWLQRFLTVIAGVTFNFILALIIFLVFGIFAGVDDGKPYISAVSDSINSSLVNKGDKVLELNGKKVLFAETLKLRIYINNGNPIKLKLQDSSGSVREVTLNPYEVTEDGVTSYKYGIGVGGKTKTGIIDYIKYPFVMFASLVSQMFLEIWYLIIGKLSVSNLSGPVGIFNVVGESVSAGFIYYIYLIGFISLNVGFINLLPIPALDGGRILFMIIEKITGKELNPKVENIIHTVGFVLLMLLMVIITFNDIIKLFFR